MRHGRALPGSLLLLRENGIAFRDGVEDAYRALLDHVADCGREAGAGYDEMREYISAVMADWPARTAPPPD